MLYARKTRSILLYIAMFDRTIGINDATKLLLLLRGYITENIIVEIRIKRYIHFLIFPSNLITITFKKKEVHFEKNESVY